MKKLPFRLIFISISLLFFSKNAQSQKLEYVITTEGDTTFGIVKAMSYKWVKFQSDQQESIKKLSAGEIKECMDAGKVYSSQLMPLELTPNFLEILESGQILVYQYLKVTNAANNNYILRWYAKKDDGSLVEIKSNWAGNTTRKERKENFESLIKDDAELLAEYKLSNDFDHERILDFVKRYNTRALGK